MKKLTIYSVVLAVVFALTGVAGATVDWYWDLDPATEGNWTTATNWDKDTVPGSANGDYANIDNGGTALIGTGDDVDTYLLWLGRTGSTSSGAVKMTGGTFDASYKMYIGMQGVGSFTQSGGTVTTTLFHLGGSADGVGAYTLSGDDTVLNTTSGTSRIASTGTGTFTQTGGTWNHGGDLVYIGCAAGSSGTYNLTGGTLNMTAATLNVGGYSGTSKGVLYISGANSEGQITSGTGTTDMTIKATTGTKVAGWGTIGLTGDLQNSGKVIADGYGTDRTLDLSSFATVTNDVDNTGGGLGGGWYAQGKGKLVLPTITVAASTAATYNWGESATDPGLDLVNSAQMAFDANVTGGDLDISLLATDRGDVSAIPSGYTFIGVWDFDDTDFDMGTGSVNLVFRYDAALAATLGIDEADLKVFHYTGGSWVDITTSVSTSIDRISANGIESFSQFSVGVVPEPATVGLLGIGGLLALIRKNR